MISDNRLIKGWIMALCIQTKGLWCPLPLCCLGETSLIGEISHGDIFTGVAAGSLIWIWEISSLIRLKLITDYDILLVLLCLPKRPQPHWTPPPPKLCCVICTSSLPTDPLNIHGSDGVSNRSHRCSTGSRSGEVGGRVIIELPLFLPRATLIDTDPCRNESLQVWRRPETWSCFLPPTKLHIQPHIGVSTHETV